MLLGEFWYDPAPFGNNDDDDDDDNDDDDASVFSLLVVSSHSNVQFTIYRLPPRLFGFPSLLFHLSLRAVRRDQNQSSKISQIESGDPGESRNPVRWQCTHSSAATILPLRCT